MSREIRTNGHPTYAQTRAVYSSSECTTLPISLLFVSLGSPMLGMSQVKLAPHWISLAAAIWRCSPKLSLRSNCAPQYFMLLFNAVSRPPSTIFGYSKDLLTSKASVISRAIFRPLLFNNSFARYRLLLISSSRISTSLETQTTNSSAKPMILIPAGRSMRKKSSYITFHTNSSARDPWGHHMSSVLRETMCRTGKSPTCRLDSYLSSATGSLELSYALSTRFSPSVSQSWTERLAPNSTWHIPPRQSKAHIKLTPLWAEKHHSAAGHT